MNILQNLCPHESILLILGIIMFSALIFSLVWSVVKEKKIGILLPFFLLPIIMIGYPSLGAMQFEEGKINLQSALDKLMDGNIQEGEYEEFTNAYLSIAQSCKANHDPEAQATMAGAQLATGNYEEAREIAERTLQLQPQNTMALEVRQKSSEQIQRTDEFTNQINDLNRTIALMEAGNMDREQGINRMTPILSEIKPPQNIETQDALNLAKALAYTGEKESAIKMVDQVLQKPGIEREEMVRARELKNEIESDLLVPSQGVSLQAQQPNINPALTPEMINRQKLKTRISTNLQLSPNQ